MGVVELALQVLAKEEVSRREMRVRARNYLDSLNQEEYSQLAQEALRDDGENGHQEKKKLLRQLGFTEREVSDYCRCRLNTPGMRKVIARRALLAKLTKMDASQIRKGHFYQITRMEDAQIGDLPTEEMIRRLCGNGSKRAR